MDETMAETLIAVADNVLRIHGLIHGVELSGGGPARDNTVMARIAIAIKFRRLPPAVQFRAICESWDLARIKAEVWT